MCITLVANIINILTCVKFFLGKNQQNSVTRQNSMNILWVGTVFNEYQPSNISLAERRQWNILETKQIGKNIHRLLTFASCCDLLSPVMFPLYRAMVQQGIVVNIIIINCTLHIGFESFKVDNGKERILFWVPWKEDL